jgi:hypothetical protein
VAVAFRRSGCIGGLIHVFRAAARQAAAGLFRYAGKILGSSTDLRNRGTAKPLKTLNPVAFLGPSALGS